MESVGVQNDELAPAERLEGLTLESGWRVLKRVDRVRGQTGSHFSVGYLAQQEDSGAIAFMKALDFSDALQQEDLLGALDTALGGYIFEKELLDLCLTQGMTHVVRTLATGFVRVDKTPLGRVPYLLFEPADGDTRKAIGELGFVDQRWAIQLLHEVAVGLQQLHHAQIAHQDLKPSNVLAYRNGAAFKIADLGCDCGCFRISGQPSSHEIDDRRLGDVRG